jgi:YHS domain-containing protein
MSQQQIKELASTKQVTDKVFIMAPATGFIIARNVSPGQRFDKGAEWYRIADLSRVWVLADLFRNEAEYVRPGLKVRVTIPETKKTLHAVVSTVLPQFDATSRTLKVRLELDNPGYTLRPDMFVDVEFPVTLPSALTVPRRGPRQGQENCLCRSRQRIFEPGKLNRLADGQPGRDHKGLGREHIVMSGNFLIDSESRLEMAAQGMYGTLSKDPVCGVDVSINKAEKTGRKSVYQGETYYFSSDECKEQFEKNPSRYIER